MTTKYARIKIISAECRESDDEGANNKADVDRMDIGFTAACNGVAPTNSSLYTFNTSGEVGVDVGDMWNFKASGSSPVVEGTALFTDWDSAVLTLRGNAREYDSAGGDEYSHGNVVLKGDQMQGEHAVYVDGDDVAFNVKLKVTVTEI